MILNGTNLKREGKDCLDFGIFITYHSIFITYHSKMVEPRQRKAVWICFQVLFSSLNFLIFE